MGAVLTAAVAIVIFLVGNFSTQATLEKSIVKTWASEFDSINQGMTYEQALKVLAETQNENKQLKNDNAKLKNQVNSLNDQAPQSTSKESSTSTASSNGTVDLSKMTPVSGTLDSDYYRIWDPIDVDNYGNKYISGIYISQTGKNRARLIYALDTKYSVLTGKFVLSQDSKNTDGHYSIYFYSLVDGNETLLYESPKLSTATRPINTTVDVTGVSDLVIEVYDSDKTDNNAWCAFVNAMLK